LGLACGFGVMELDGGRPVTAKWTTIDVAGPAVSFTVSSAATHAQARPQLEGSRECSPSIVALPLQSGMDHGDVLAARGRRAVGFVADAASHQHVAVWTRVDGDWHVRDLGSFGDETYDHDASSGSHGALDERDPHDGSLLGTVTVNGDVDSVSGAFGSLWTLDARTSTVHRPTPDTAGHAVNGSSTSAFARPNPAVRWTVNVCVLASLVAIGTGCTSSNNRCSNVKCAPPSRTNTTSKLNTSPSVGERLVVSIAMPTPGSVAAAFGSIWVGNGESQTVTRVDPRTDAVIARIPTPDPATVIGVGAGAIWVTSFPGNSLTRIDPGNNRVTRTISLAPRGAGAIGVTVFRGFVWVANHNGLPTMSVSKIDPATMRVVDVIPVGAGSSAGPVWILSSAGSIWTDVNGNANVVVRIDPRTDRILARIPAPSACTELAADDTGVWGAGDYGDSCRPGVSRIDPRTNRVTATFDEGGAADAVALDHGSLWYGTTATHKLGRIDTRTNKVVCLLNLPGPAFGMAAGADAIWTTDRDDGLLFKVSLAHACQPGG
jgi:streptogramin lyase